MKVIAMYLPQFHRTEDNDRWWGEGFTEWTAVKGGKPLFPGHRQPRRPLGENYYNLLDPEVMRRQAELMERYHVDGMCFYHYWFKDGRQALERPAEVLLEEKDIPMPFCFCWANEGWARTWSNLTEKNVWSVRGETKEERERHPDGVLLEQKYGGEEAWKQHFDYLLPFFLDSRYIRFDGKPVFLIYKPGLIGCMPAMRERWQQYAREAGLEGIYWIAMNEFQDRGYDGYLYHEPQYTFMHMKEELLSDPQKPVRRLAGYSQVWDSILRRRIPDMGRDVFLGGFCGFDDTPRRGGAGTVVTGEEPGLFKEKLRGLMKKSSLLGSPAVFLNAWNEWGEGMYLEPDEEYGYGFLEAVREAAETYAGAVLPEEADEEGDRALAARYRGYWRILHQWLLLKERHIRLGDVLAAKGLRQVAVYGLGMLGLHLVKELEEGPVRIRYGIDRNAAQLQMGFPVLPPEEGLWEADAVIVTVIQEYEGIYRRLKEARGDLPVYSLAELIEEAAG